MLYLIRILPTAQLLPKLRGHILQIFPTFYWLKIILINQESILVYKKGSKILQRFLA